MPTRPTSSRCADASGNAADSSADRSDRRHVVFAYEGLDGLLRRTIVAFTPAEVAPSEQRRLDRGRRIGSPALAAQRRARGERRDPLGGHDRPPADEGRGGAAEATPTRLATSIVSHHAQPAADAPAGSSAATPIAEPAVAEEEYGSWLERCARIRSDGELLDLAIRRSIADLRLLRNDGPDARRALRRGGRPVVHDPVRARQHHHRRSRSCRSCPTSRARRSRCSPTGRRPRTTPSATWSRARSSTSSGSASWRERASCHIARTTAASTRRRCG